MTKIIDLLNKAKCGSFVITMGERIRDLECSNEFVYAQPGMMGLMTGVEDPGMVVDDGKLFFAEHLMISVSYRGFEHHNAPLECGENMAFLQEHAGYEVDPGVDFMTLLLESGIDLADPLADITCLISIMDDSLLGKRRERLNTMFRASGHKNYRSWLISSAAESCRARGVDFARVCEESNGEGWMEDEVSRIHGICP